MTKPVSVGQAVKRMQEMRDRVTALAIREEGIATGLRNMASDGALPSDVQHRARARADTLMRLAADLRNAVDTPIGRNW